MAAEICRSYFNGGYFLLLYNGHLDKSNSHLFSKPLQNLRPGSLRTVFAQAALAPGAPGAGCAPRAQRQIIARRRPIT